MNNKNVTIISKIPVGGSGAISATLAHSSTNCVLRYSFETDEGCLSYRSVVFTAVIAYRFSNEMHSRGFLDGSLDAIVEAQNSPWMDEIIRREPSCLQWPWRKRHFAVFLTNCGYYEAIADNVQLVEKCDFPYVPVANE